MSVIDPVADNAHPGAQRVSCGPEDRLAWFAARSAASQQLKSDDVRARSVDTPSDLV